MNNQWTGFLTGFLNTTGESIKKRKDEAEKYFNDQMEMARTVGMENRAKRQQEMNASLSTAKQLIARGVPKDVVMSIANQNPDDLGTFNSMVDKLEMNGVHTSPEFFKSIAKSSGNFKAPDEDLGTFFDRIYRPLVDNHNAEPDAFKNDPHGSVWSTMMGYNAMDRARDKLSNTKLIGDESAQDVINYGYSNQRSHPYGESTVTYDYGQIGDASRTAAAGRKGNTPLSPAEVDTINKQFDSTAQELYMGKKKEIMQWNADHPDQKPQEVPEGPWDKSPWAGEIGKATADKLKNDYGYDVGDTSRIPRIANPDKVFAPAKTATPAPTASGATTTPAPTADAAAPTSMPKSLRNGDTFVKDAGDGTSVWRRPNGSLYRAHNTKVLEFQTKPPASAAPTTPPPTSMYDNPSYGGI